MMRPKLYSLKLFGYNLEILQSLDRMHSLDSLCSLTHFLPDEFRVYI